MKPALLCFAAVACSHPGAGDDMTPGDGGAPTDAVLDRIFASVDQAQIKLRLDELVGVTPVSAGGSTFRITNRWAPGAKANFRAYWQDYFETLGATVNVLA